MKMFSTHVPLTVMVLGPCGSRVLSAAVMLGYVPPLPPGQPTVAFAACAAAGSRKEVTKIANTKPLNVRFFLKAMLLFFKFFIVVSPGNSFVVPEIACDTLRGI